MITITDKGAEKVREFFAGQSADVSTAGLRVGVKGGGCSGFQYQLAFDEQRDTDAVFEDHGLMLLADRQSLPYVAGSVIDYEESLQGAGFRVNNPNVVAACGCGSSFRVAEEEQVSARHLFKLPAIPPPVWQPPGIPPTPSYFESHAPPKAGHARQFDWFWVIPRAQKSCYSKGLGWIIRNLELGILELRFEFRSVGSFGR